MDVALIVPINRDLGYSAAHDSTGAGSDLVVRFNLSTCRPIRVLAGDVEILPEKIAGRA
jgi:hypothetical protein